VLARRARRTAVLAALTCAMLTSVLMVGQVSSASAGPEYYESFCKVWLGPYGKPQGPDRCYATGHYLVQVLARSFETSVCVDATQNGNLVHSWSCNVAGSYASDSYDGSRWLNGVVRNNNPNVSTLVWEALVGWN
jgi:hypothetical protein